MGSTLKPKTEYEVELKGFKGGLNLRDADYCLSADESPEMVNMLWRNGFLASRKGQCYLARMTANAVPSTVSDEAVSDEAVSEESVSDGAVSDEAVSDESVSDGRRFSQSPVADRMRTVPTDTTGTVPTDTTTGHAVYGGVWHGHLFAHIGLKLYAISVADGTYTELATVSQELPGTWFMYGGALYYKSYAIYKKITATEGTGGAWSFVCTNVVPYVPVIVMNASYVDGSGDMYQPENRYSPQKTIWFNAASGVKSFKLPVVADYIVKVVVDGVIKTSGWTYNATTGVVTFSVAPPVTDPATNNTVRITYSKSNITAYNSVNFARYAAVHGGTGELCVVMAGSELQRNAYFWSGNSDTAMDPGYFPMEQYQIAGETENPITGFGKQQSNLIVFQETAIGKASLSVEEIDGRNSISMPYTPINAKIGCNMPWTIQLVENNLVWANSNGVYTLLDTTEANENFIVCISEKINGDPPSTDSLSIMMREMVSAGDGAGCKDVSDGVVSDESVSDGAVSEESVSDGRRFSQSPVGDRMRTVHTDTTGTVPTDTTGVVPTDTTGDALADIVTRAGVNDVGSRNDGNASAAQVGASLSGAELNDAPVRAGLIYDLSLSDADCVCAVDDEHRYWLLCNGHAWVWDYKISTYSDPSWFYQTGINGVSVSCGNGNGSSSGETGGTNEIYQLLSDGSVAKFQNAFNDFGIAIERAFRTPVQTFDEYDRLKNVNSVIVSMAADSATNTAITYITDYGSRTDPTNLQVVAAATYDANRVPGTRPISGVRMAVFRRRPMCRRIIHFAMRLADGNINEDMGIVGFRIFYEKLGRLR